MSVPLPARNESPAAMAVQAPSPALPPRAVLARLLARPRLWGTLALLGLLLGAFLLLRPQVLAWHHFRAARLDLERYHNRQAILHLQACLRTWPTDPDVLL